MSKKFGIFCVIALSLVFVHQTQAEMATVSGTSITKVDIKAGPSLLDGPITVPAGGVYVGWQSYNGTAMVNTYGNTPCVGSANPARPDFKGNYVSTGDIFFNQTVSTAYTITCGGASDTVVVNIQGQPAYSGPVPMTTTTQPPTTTTGTPPVTPSSPVNSNAASVTLKIGQATVISSAFISDPQSGWSHPAPGTIATVDSTKWFFLTWNSTGAVSCAFSAPLLDLNNNVGVQANYIGQDFLTFAPGDVHYPSVSGTTYTITCKDVNGLTTSDSVKVMAITPASNTPIVPAPIANPLPVACLQLTSVIAEGSTGADVTTLQKFLVSQGYLTMPASANYGTFGSLTAAAVLRFQSAHGLDPVGSVGPKTRALIAALSCNGGISSTTPPPSSANGALSVDLKVNDVDGPISIVPGATILLSWHAEPANSSTLRCSGTGATGLWADGKPLLGLTALNPTSNTTYTLTCTDLATHLSVSDSVTVMTNGTANTGSTSGSGQSSTGGSSATTGGNAGVAADLKASTDGIHYTDGPITIQNGNQLWFQWTTSANNGCSIPNPGYASFGGAEWLGLSAGGGYAFGPVAPYFASFTPGSQTTYNLTCSNALGNGQTYIDDSVTIIAPQTYGIASPSVNLKANGSDGPVTVNAGTIVNLSWTSNSTGGSYYCNLSANGIPMTAYANQSANGNLSVSAGSTNTTYSIVCTGYQGSAVTSTDNVTVIPNSTNSGNFSSNQLILNTLVTPQTLSAANPLTWNFRGQGFKMGMQIVAIPQGDVGPVANVSTYLAAHGTTNVMAPFTYVAPDGTLGQTTLDFGCQFGTWSVTARDPATGNQSNPQTLVTIPPSGGVAPCTPGVFIR